MSSRGRIYEARVATAGASVVAGNVAFTLDLSDLAEPPVVHGPTVKARTGHTEANPFRVSVVDVGDSLTALLASSGRWAAVGRLLDVRYSDNAGGAWTVYGTGRISAVREADGPGRFEIEVSDESFLTRTPGRIFEPDPADSTTWNTTQIWPMGLRARWLGIAGFQKAAPADGTLETTVGSLHQIKLVAGGDTQGRTYGREVTGRLLAWLEDRKAEEPLRSTNATGGNFGPLRLNYGGTDYEVVSFAGSDNDVGDILETVRQPGKENEKSEFRKITIRAWVHSAVAPGATGDAFLWAPTAAPSKDTPLHVGHESATHEWGSSDILMHMADFTRRVWDALGVLYDDTALTATEADSSIPWIAPRITEVPENVEKWMEENIWAPHMHIALRDSQGRRKLVDLRLPQDIDPDLLTVLDAGNTRDHTWELTGRETVNSIVWEYLQVRRSPGTAFVTGIASGNTVGEFVGPEPDLDNLIVTERTTDAIEGDTVGTVGRRELKLSFRAKPSGALSVIDGVDFVGGKNTTYTEEISRDLLDMYQDGPVRGRLEVGETTAATLEEGELVILDQDELKGANPETDGRTGQRIVRVVSITRHPAHSVVDYLDIGPKLQPLGAPTIALTQTAGGDLQVAISALPAGSTAVVELGYNATATAPSTWVERRKDVGNETLTFTDVPGTGWAHARAKSVAPGRIRSPWASDSLQIASDARVTDVELAFNGTGVPVVFAEINADTAGAKIRFGVFEEGAADNFGAWADYDATLLPDGITLTGESADFGERGVVEVEPYPGFAAGSVSGTAGPVVRTATRRRQPDENLWLEVNKITLRPEHDLGLIKWQVSADLQIGTLVQKLKVDVLDSPAFTGGAFTLRYTYTVAFSSSSQHIVQDGSGNTKLFTPPILPGTINVVDFTPLDADDVEGATHRVLVDDLNATGVVGARVSAQDGTVTQTDKLLMKADGGLEIEEDGDGRAVAKVKPEDFIKSGTAAPGALEEGHLYARFL